MARGVMAEYNARTVQGCLTVEDVALYVSGGASYADRLGTIAEHVDGCDSCRSAIAAAVRAARSSQPALAHDDVELAIGALVGRYRIKSMRGSGAMGHIFEAEDPDLDRVVALKIVRNAGDDARALREGRALARLAHPNVVAIYDVGVWSGGVFLAMELVDGVTLRTWAAQPRPWREVVRMFIAAAEALDAAHRRGLVHRDVKPDNMVVGADGRLRVIDFGLAVDHDAHAPVSGTPAYMAPEQKSAAKGDARSDQFALFTSLYEVLEGARPAAAIHFARRVPSALRATIRRGLRANPDERFADLGAAARALRRVLGQRRRAALALASLGVVAAVATTAVVASRKQALCGGARAALAGAWDAPRRQAIEASFQALHLPYAAAVWKTASRQLDTYSNGWVAMHTEACKATHERGEQSAELLDLRMACLRTRRDHLQALTDLLATARDPSVVERTVSLAGSLPSLAECANREALTTPMRLPSDPIARASLVLLQQEISRAALLSDAGRAAQASAIIARVVPAARASGHLPTLALALVEQGAEEVVTQRHPAAESTLREAVRTAEAARLDTAKVDVLVLQLASLTSAAVFKGAGDVAHGRELAKDAEAVLERIGGDDSRKVRLRENLAILLRLGDKLDEALHEYEQIIALEKDPTKPIRLAGTEVNMANVLADLGQLDRAAQLLRHARGVFESALGAEHPKVAAVLNSLAGVYIDQAKPAEAKPLLERALVIQRALDAPGIGLTLVNLAYAYGYLGDSQNALKYFQEAHAFYVKTSGEKTVFTAMTLEGIGAAQRGLNHLDLAEENFQRAFEIRLELSGPDDSDVAQSHRDLGSLFLEAHKKLAAGRAHYAEALRIDELVMGKDNVKLVPDLNGVGRGDLELHDARHAVAVLERALALTKQGNVEPQQLGRTHFLLARALWDSGGDRARAKELAQTARTTLASAELADAKEDLRDVDTWLASHR